MKNKKHSHRKKWWKNALFFIKWKNTNAGDLNSGSFHRRRTVSGRTTYGPVYITESRTVSSSPCRKTRRRSSGRLAGIMIPSKKSELEIPYINLKEFKVDRISRISAAPIYLITWKTNLDLYWKILLFLLYKKFIFNNIYLIN